MRCRGGWFLGVNHEQELQNLQEKVSIEQELPREKTEISKYNGGEIEGFFSGFDGYKAVA